MRRAREVLPTMKAPSQAAIYGEASADSGAMSHGPDIHRLLDLIGIRNSLSFLHHPRRLEPLPG